MLDKDKELEPYKESKNGEEFDSYESSNLDSFTCKLWVMLASELKYDRFISTKELEKLKTCNDLGELSESFELEKQILDIIFLNNPDLKKKDKFTEIVQIKIENYEILDLIEKFVSYSYIIANTKDYDEDNIEAIKIYVEKDLKGRFYISFVEVLNILE